jgi:DNA replication protein DnaC
VSHREERRIQMGTGIAKFPHQRTLEGFDFAAQPSLDAKHVAAGMKLLRSAG